MIAKPIQIFRLVKMRHALFGLPFTLSSMLIAANGIPEVETLLLILLAFLCGRSLGMSLNRLWDRGLDARNPRTEHRLMAKGEVSPMGLLPYLLLFSLGLIYCGFALNETTFLLLPLCFLFLILYPLAKRVTIFAHLILGLVLSLAPIGAWAAIRNSIDLVPILLGVGVLLWVSGFDIIYALQDEVFDRKEGLYSIPARFGSRTSLVLAGCFHLLSPILWACAGFFASLGPIYFTGVSIIGLVLIFEHILAWKRTTQSLGFAFFQLNTLISMGFLATVTAEILI